LDNSLPEKNPWPQAYLYYIKAVCAARLLSYDKSIEAYGHIQVLVEKINQIMQDEEKAKQYKTNIAMAKGAFGVAAMVASAFIGGGTGYASDMASNVSINVLASGFNDAMLIRRKYAFVGESEYSRNLNVLLNIDEQLLLFDALGAAFHSSGNKEKSIFFNREAINIINHMRSTIATEKHRITFARQKDRIFNRLIDDLIAENEISEAFRYSENARSRAFIDLLASNPGIRYKNSQIQNYISNVRAHQLYYDQLRKQINISESQALYLNNETRGLQLAPGQDSNENRAQKEASQSGNGINDIDEISSLVTVQNVSVNEIQNLLPKNYQLIEFYISENNVYTWIIDRNRQVLQRLNTPRSKITERCLALRQMIRSPDIANIKSEEVINLARVLYADLFKPLRPHLNGNKIFIVPHRSLHFLPFDVLHDGKHFLVEKFSFSYLPSAAAMRFLKNRNSRLQSALVFGNPATDDAISLPPLEWAEKEALEIGRSFASCKVFTRADATKTRFLTLSNKFDVVHFACHASMDPSKPMNSRLYLAKDPSQNGYLTLADLYALKMNASLVVLSACETGLAQLETGDELIGLVRGFFFAGTRSVVASLWRVNDEATMMLMLSFYKNIKAKIPPSEALRNAKIDLLKSTIHTHPFFWSAFNFYGIDV
jgi:CHAT domain-containing protein